MPEARELLSKEYNNKYKYRYKNLNVRINLNIATNAYLIDQLLI